MRKILFLLILAGCTAFSDCTAKSEIAVKKLAAESINKNHSSISNCCNGKQKTAYGYVWKFI